METYAGYLLLWLLSSIISQLLEIVINVLINSDSQKKQTSKQQTAGAFASDVYVFYIVVINTLKCLIKREHVKTLAVGNLISVPPNKGFQKKIAVF